MFNLKINTPSVRNQKTWRNEISLGEVTFLPELSSTLYTDILDPFISEIHYIDCLTNLLFDPKMYKYIYIDIIYIYSYKYLYS